jgi:hypothetical protein
MGKSNAGARGEGDEDMEGVKERKTEMIVCVVCVGSVLILF